MRFSSQQHFANIWFGFEHNLGELTGRFLVASIPRVMSYPYFGINGRPTLLRIRVFVSH